jgi:lipoprotein-releasing system ATP-binding protein
MNNPIIQASNITKTYRENKINIDVLKGLELNVFEGEQCAIIGPSGSGKSTLLHLLGGLDKVTSGSIKLLGFDINRVSEKKRCQLRNKNLGFVYQFHHLLPEFSALENVMMPLLISGMKSVDAKEQALDMLDKVALSHRLKHKPATLSGGERQRVAIARALVTNPRCLLADEPTGNLDQNTATQVFDLIIELNETLKTAIVIVTHDLALAAKMSRILRLNDGVLQQLESINSPHEIDIDNVQTHDVIS